MAKVKLWRKEYFWLIVQHHSLSLKKPEEEYKQVKNLEAADAEPMGIRFTLLLITAYSTCFFYFYRTQDN